MAHMPAAAHAPMAHHMMLGPFKVRSVPPELKAAIANQDGGARTRVLYVYL